MTKVITTSESARKELIQGLFPSTQPPANAKAVFDGYDQQMDITFKKKIIVAVTSIFIVSVAVLWLGIIAVAITDYIYISSEIIIASERVVTEKVLFALIAGTVTQVSISFGFMIKYMFSKQEEPEKPSPSSP